MSLFSRWIKILLIFFPWKFLKDYFRLLSMLKLPIFLDSIGTVLVGIMAGPWAGGLTGLLPNCPMLMLLGLRINVISKFEMCSDPIIEL